MLAWQSVKGKQNMAEWKSNTSEQNVAEMKRPLYQKNMLTCANMKREESQSSDTR